jgi:hypothetical protein
LDIDFSGNTKSNQNTTTSVLDEDFNDASQPKSGMGDLVDIFGKPNPTNGTDMSSNLNALTLEPSANNLGQKSNEDILGLF